MFVESVRSEPRDWAFGVSRDAVTAMGFSAALLVAFAVTPYLPMVDLPQHAAQISVWLHLHDPRFPMTRYFRLNLGTPYLGAYAAARVLAGWVGVVAALKGVVWGSAVLYWFAFSRLVRRLGYPPWLGLLGLPLGLGYPFYFGLVSFIAAMPFVLFSMSAALAHREAPTLAHGLVLAVLLSATLVMHGFALGVAVMMVGPSLLRGGGRLFARLLPLSAPAVLWAVWVAPGGSIRTIGATVWAPRGLELFSSPALWFAASAADHVALLFGYATLALVAVALGRPARHPERWAPLALLLAAFCLFPIMLSGFGPLHPRFAAFFVPALLVAFEPRERLRASWVSRVVPVFVGTWFSLLAVRLAAFTKETRPVRDFVAQMPEGLSVRPVVFGRESSAFPGLPALLHLSAYYMAEKGGLQGYSFAMYPTSVIRYVGAFVPGMPGGAEWHPEWLSAAELDRYDVFLIHAAAERTLALFRAHAMEPIFHEGDWWAYRSPRPAVTEERTQ